MPTKTCTLSSVVDRLCWGAFRYSFRVLAHSIISGIPKVFIESLDMHKGDVTLALVPLGTDQHLMLCIFHKHAQTELHIFCRKSQGSTHVANRRQVYLR